MTRSALWLFFTAFFTLALSCRMKNQVTENASHRTSAVIPVAPCNDATTFEDPNNCGTCGTLCGTYGLSTGGGVSFLQGRCFFGVCTPYRASLASLDCFDLANGSVVGGSSGSPVCVSLLSSSQNCGGLGWSCAGGCTNGNCSGPLTKPTAPTLVGPTSVALSTTKLYSFSGGVGPNYTCAYAPQGDNDGGSVTTIAADGGGAQCQYTTGNTPGLSVLVVTDTVGQQAIYEVVVMGPTDTTDLAWWLRADQVVSSTDGAKFTSWTDLVNSGATYTQATSSHQLSWNASDALYGNQPSVSSSAAAFMTLTGRTGATGPAQPFTIYAVLNTTAPSTYQIIVADSSDSQESGMSNGVNGWYYYGPSAQVAGTVTTGPHAVAWIHHGTSSAIYVDISATPVGTLLVSTGNSATTYTLGFNAGVDGLLGHFPEAMAYTTAHNASQVALNFQYFASRYANTWQ